MLKKIMVLAIAVALGLSMAGSVQAAHKGKKSTAKTAHHKGKVKQENKKTEKQPPVDPAPVTK